jgi:hypothetical protein
VPGGVDHQERDEDRCRRIGPLPAEGPDQDAGGDGLHAAQGVGEDVQPGAAHVQALVPPAAQDAQADQVDRQAADGDADHDRGLDGGGVAEPVGGLDHHPDRDGRESGAVGQGGEDLGAVIAPGAARVGRALGDPHGEQGEAEGRGVGQHVPGVGEEGQGAGEPAAHGLGQHVGRGEAQGEREPAAVAGGGLAVPVVVVMCVSGTHGKPILARVVALFDLWEYHACMARDPDPLRTLSSRLIGALVPPMAALVCAEEDCPGDGAAAVAADEETGRHGSQTSGVPAPHFPV